jgi:hypothetical protein
MSVHFEESNFISSMIKPVVLELVPEQWQNERSITFSEFSLPAGERV